MATASIDPLQHPALTTSEAGQVKQITDFTREYFDNPKFDSSHDFNHVMRVVANAIHIWEKECSQNPHSMSIFTVILAALMHDVSDRKYIDPSDVGVPIVERELARFGVSGAEAQKVQSVVDGVSYSSEIKSPDRVKTLIDQFPELAVVQDADRLDAIGAVGIARVFTFGGAKSSRLLEDSVKHFHDKLLKLESMMKTQTGKTMAAERTRRLREYLSWWQEETRGDTKS